MTDEQIRVLLVDDEEVARERLRQLLAPLPDLEIVGEAEDGEEALSAIAELGPDLVFLDIQMPTCSGMEVAASLPSPRPRIIFCTAYDQYAIDAFELHAVDYLLKPVTRARLKQAVERVRKGSESEAESRLELLSAGYETGPRRFLARRAGRFTVVPEQEVLYFATEEGMTRLFTREQHYWIEPTLSDLEKRLSEQRFCRVSRQALVALDKVKEVAPLVGGYGELKLEDGTRLDVSRRRFKELLRRLGGKE